MHDDIRDTIARYEELQNDPEPFLQLHHPLITVVNIMGRRVLGADAFGEAMRAALATPLRDVRTTLDIDDIRLIRPDVAIVSLTKTVHDEREGADSALPVTGSLTLVLTRESGEWKIALSQTTPRE